jgi:hypothetical protein
VAITINAGIKAPDYPFIPLSQESALTLGNIDSYLSVSKLGRVLRCVAAFLLGHLIKTDLWSRKGRFPEYDLDTGFVRGFFYCFYFVLIKFFCRLLYQAPGIKKL